MSELRNLIALAVDESGGGHDPDLVALQELADTGELTREALDREFDPPSRRARVYLQCVASALRDHALTRAELFGLRQLRRAFRIEDGDLATSHRDEVTKIVGDVMRRILLDSVVDEEEARYQVAVQESLSLGYDEFLQVAWEPLHEALMALLAEIDPESKGLSEEEFSEYERRALRLQSVFRLDAEYRDGGEARSRHIPQHVKDAVWRRDQGRCVSCGSAERLELDHIIPFSRGGANTYRNVQLLCEPCNRKKSDAIG